MWANVPTCVLTVLWPLDPARVLSIDSRTWATGRLWRRRQNTISFLADKNTDSLLRNFVNHVFFVISTLCYAWAAHMPRAVVFFNSMKK